MAYKVILKPSAEKQFSKLPSDVQKRLFRLFSSLADDPRPHGSIKLQDANGYYRIRSGDYRCVYSIQDQECLILVLIIDHRRNVYRSLNR